MKRLILLLLILALGWIGWHWHQGVDPVERFRAPAEPENPTEELIDIVRQSLSPLNSASGSAMDRERQLNLVEQQFHGLGSLTAEQRQALDRVKANLRRLNQDRERFETSLAEASARDYATLSARDESAQRKDFFIQGVERNWQNSVQHYRPLLRHDLNTLLGPEHRQQVMAALHMD